MRVAILKKDFLRRANLVRALEHEFTPPRYAISCVCFDQDDALRRALRHETFDLLILDWEPSDSVAIDFLRWLRRYREDPVPVLVLSSRTAPQDAAEALDAGADDYLPKPFHRVELGARIRRLKTRQAKAATALASSRPSDRPVHFGEWTFDRSRLALQFTRTGEVLSLTDREFSIALALFRHRGSPVSRDYLLEICSIQGTTETSRALDNHIYRLRHKLSRLDGEARLRLQTVYGRGYRLEGADAPPSID